MAGTSVVSLRDVCERVLRQNWREGVSQRTGAPFAYTCPSPTHYPWQWYWDSCFAALVWRRFDPDRSRRELESLLSARDPDGFIGHTIFWNTPLSGVRRFTYNVLSPTAAMTSSIQPPALAWSWRIAVGDPSLEPGICQHQEWLERHRDLDGDGLIWIVQPDESGLDASPQFDPIWRGRAHGRLGFLRLVRRNRGLGYDLGRIAAAGGPVCCEVVTNVLYSLSRVALGKTSLTPAIVARMYDEDAGLFASLPRPRPGRPLPVTWAALAPLALPDLPESIGRRLVEEHLLDAGQFWSAVPPPSVSLREPSFQGGESRHLGARRYWRGPTWINAAWLVWLGLIRLDYREQADRLSQAVGRTVAREGLREYYNPMSGAGLGARDFAWSTLVMEMVDPDPAASNSYLPQ